MKVIDKASNYAVYAGLNPPDIPKSIVTRLVIYPPFFGVSGMRVDEFAQLLLDRYNFVGKKLHDGSKKDQCSQCMVGLLATGESIILKFDGEDHWWLEVEKASNDFADNFRAPKF
jgi:hypothetical protein